MTSIPAEHIDDAFKLVADGEVHLFELTPVGGGTVYFKADNEVVWQGNTYEGMPVGISGIKRSSTGSSLSPKLVIGDGAADLSVLKPLVFDGWLENASVKHIVVKLDNLLNNRPIAEMRIYRVKRVEEYHRFLISIQLATSSDALGFTLPHRQYRPPAYPSVTLG